MEDLPESLLLDILRRIDQTADRNSLSLVCRRLHRVEGEQRDSLRVGCGLHPAIEALTALCIRFPSLSKLEIVYSGWMSSLGKQLGNEGLQVISSNCHSLTELSLAFCSFINDTGLGYLSSCRKLLSLKLNFAPGISSNGILSVVLGCKDLSILHLIRCVKVSSVEWLQLLGSFGNVRDLSIKNCRGVREDDLINLGFGWRKLQRLEFAVDAYYRYPRYHDQLLFSEWHREVVFCDELKELSLTNCIVAPDQGLSFVLGRCGALEKLHLDMCFGVTDNDMIALSRKSCNLRSLSLHLPSQYAGGSILANNLMPLKDDSLRALAVGCPLLDMLELSFSDWVFPSMCCFTQDAVVCLIQSCPIRVLKLNNACLFNDIGMDAICSAQCLQVLELSKCQEVSDEGLLHVMKLTSLKVVKLCKCLGVTDIGLKPFVGTQKLDLLIVEDCLQISETGIKGAAKSISYSESILSAKQSSVVAYSLLYQEIC